MAKTPWEEKLDQLIADEEQQEEAFKAVMLDHIYNDRGRDADIVYHAEKWGEAIHRLDIHTRGLPKEKPA